MSTLHLPEPPIPQLADVNTLRACARRDPGWIWHGYLKPGNATLLTSQWKAGKTTLVSVLLSKMATGGTLAGLAVRPGRAIVVSEESAEHWLARDDRLHFGPNIQFICRPFRGRPTVANHLTDEHCPRFKCRQRDALYNRLRESINCDQGAIQRGFE